MKLVLKAAASAALIAGLAVSASAPAAAGHCYKFMGKGYGVDKSVACSFADSALKRSIARWARKKGVKPHVGATHHKTKSDRDLLVKCKAWARVCK